MGTGESLERGQPRERLPGALRLLPGAAGWGGGGQRGGCQEEPRGATKWGCPARRDLQGLRGGDTQRGVRGGGKGWGHPRRGVQRGWWVLAVLTSHAWRFRGAALSALHPPRAAASLRGWDLPQFPGFEPLRRHRRGWGENAPGAAPALGQNRPGTGGDSGQTSRALGDGPESEPHQLWGARTSPGFSGVPERCWREQDPGRGGGCKGQQLSSSSTFWGVSG